MSDPDHFAPTGWRIVAALKPSGASMPDPPGTVPQCGPRHDPAAEHLRARQRTTAEETSLADRYLDTVHRAETQARAAHAAAELADDSDAAARRRAVLDQLRASNDAYLARRRGTQQPTTAKETP